MLSLTLTFYFTLAPDIFCVSVEGVKAKFCWKDPTHGQFVNNYQLQFTVNDKNITTRPVAIHGKRNEICTSVSGQHMERSYRFTVQIFNGTDRSPASVQRFVNISKPGKFRHFNILGSFRAYI